jgi:methionyl-tRNA formyltransferase
MSMKKMKFNNILVISDNQELTTYTKKIFSEFDNTYKFKFAYSKTNQNPAKMIELGINEIDLKDEKTLENIISDFNLVISIHCKQIFPKALVSNVMCINFHPGYNPYNRGWFSQAFSIINGLPTGVTIHIMDELIDHGLIIDQETINICLEDTSYETYRKIIELEKKLITKNMKSIIHNSFTCLSQSGEGNYNSFKEYQKMCKLNLSSIGTFEEHINLLRALTHKGFRNAYFIDSNGEKYYIEVKITKDLQ